MARQKTNSPRKAGWDPVKDHADVSPAQIIKDRREQLGMGQAELAYKIGYDNPNFMSMLEMGWSRVPIEKAEIIAEVLRIPLHWLFERIMAHQSKDGGKDGALYKYLYGPKGHLRDKLEADLLQARRDVSLGSADHIAA